MLSAATVLILVSSIYRENGALNKFQNSNPSVMSEIVKQVGEDIYDTWASSCSQLPDPELIMLGLLHMAGKIAIDNNIEFANAKILAEHLGVELECNCDDCTEENESEKGSNIVGGCRVCQPVAYNPSSNGNTDEEMRDLLKD
jgi:hypothetical protein